MDTDPAPQEDPTTGIEEADLDRALDSASEGETYHTVAEEPRYVDDDAGPAVRRRAQPGSVAS
jgi:hypothetical protein